MDQAKQARRPVTQLGAVARRAPLKRQRGWVGLVGILIALVIVALLARTVLKSYGMLPGDEQADRAGTRVPPAVSSAPVDTTSAPVTPRAALDRARGLEQQVQRDAQEREKSIDEQSR